MAGLFSNVLVITDREPLGVSVQRLLRARLGKTAAVTAFTYVESLMFLTPERVTDTDLFVLELFRHYRGGCGPRAWCWPNDWAGAASEPL